MFLSFLLLVGLTLTQAGRNFVNKHGKAMYATCNYGHVISYVYSESSDDTDRLWEIMCRADPKVTSECIQSGLVGDFKKSFPYSCPPNTVLAGIDSIYDRTDRQFRFTCCKTVQPADSNCYKANYEIGRVRELTVPKHFAITAIKSWYYLSDRYFEFRLCTYSS